MDFLEKLNYLMEKEDLNKSTLSKACGIPYTTIDGWYKKGYEGLKLVTLRKLAAFFGTSLDYWTDNEVPNRAFSRFDLALFSSSATADDEVSQLTAQYNLLNDADKDLVRKMIESLAEKNSIKKSCKSDNSADLDIEAEVASYRRELELEKKRQERSKASPNSKEA